MKVIKSILLIWVNLCFLTLSLILARCSPDRVEEIAEGVTKGIIEEVKEHNSKGVF